jgi:hypothetical protein
VHSAAEGVAAAADDGHLRLATPAEAAAAASLNSSPHKASAAANGVHADLKHAAARSHSSPQDAAAAAQAAARGSAAAGSQQLLLLPRPQMPRRPTQPQNRGAAAAASR